MYEPPCILPCATRRIRYIISIAPMSCLSMLVNIVYMYLKKYLYVCFYILFICIHLLPSTFVANKFQMSKTQLTHNEGRLTGLYTYIDM